MKEKQKIIEYLEKLDSDGFKFRPTNAKNDSESLIKELRGHVHFFRTFMEDAETFIKKLEP